MSKYTGYIKVKISIVFLFFATMVLIYLLQNPTGFGCFAFLFNILMWSIYFYIDIEEKCRKDGNTAQEKT